MHGSRMAILSAAQRCATRLQFLAVYRAHVSLQRQRCRDRTYRESRSVMARWSDVSAEPSSGRTTNSSRQGRGNRRPQCAWWRIAKQRPCVMMRSIYVTLRATHVTDTIHVREADK